MMNTISILGSTGSIGRQTLDVAEQLGLRVDSSFDSAAGELSGHFAELFGISLSDDDSPEGGNAQ